MGAVLNTLRYQRLGHILDVLWGELASAGAQHLTVSEVRTRTSLN